MMSMVTTMVSIVLMSRCRNARMSDAMMPQCNDNVTSHNVTMPMIIMMGNNTK